MKPILTKAVKRRSLGAVVAMIGFMLSPLSWWNDLLVNVPLALGFAWLVSWLYPAAFGVSFVLGYWLTNVLGLVLMHRGGEAMLGKDTPYTRKLLARDLVIALGYTALIILLVKSRVFAPLPDYFTGPRSH